MPPYAKRTKPKNKIYKITKKNFNEIIEVHTDGIQSKNAVKQNGIKNGRLDQQDQKLKRKTPA